MLWIPNELDFDSFLPLEMARCLRARMPASDDSGQTKFTSRCSKTKQDEEKHQYYSLEWIDTVVVSPREKSIVTYYWIPKKG